MRRRGPSWELRVYLGRDPVSDRKRYATRSVRGSKRRAERVLRDMVAAAEVGVTHRAGATFGELCERWLAHASGHLAANTVVETRRILHRALLPRLGDVPLADLRPEHLDALYADLLRSGRRDGAPMSPATVHRIHGVARRALTVGVRWGWLTANPAFIAMPPRSTRRAISPPAPNDVSRLIAAAEPTWPCSSSWRPRPGPAGASCAGCAGQTSTSPSRGSRSPAPSSSSTATARRLRPRPARPAESHWIRPPSLPCEAIDAAAAARPPRRTRAAARQLHVQPRP